MEKIGKIIAAKKQKTTSVHAHYEFQEYGIYLSQELHDPKHKSFYIKLAKEKPRGLLEEAKGFAKDYSTKTVNRGKLFMWKLQELEKAGKGKPAL
ncbi:MAG TPA: hypothetical protein VIH52_03355 [Candidatus Nanoarchaeia archaeon]|nr:hypothetical protein [uncultured archaeon]